MPTLESLTMADIQRVVNAKSLKRARGYVRRARQLYRAGNRLTAQVTGARTYTVEIEVDEQGIHANCTCPYDWGGYCKHIGGVMLRWLQSPDDFVAGEAEPVRPVTPRFPLEVVPVDPPAARLPDEPPFWLASSVAERRTDEITQLVGQLDLLRVQDLRELARERGWRLRGTRKAELAQQLAELMTDPGEIIAAVESLDAEHERVFRALMLLGSDPGLKRDDLTAMATRWGKLTQFQDVSAYCDRLRRLGLAMSSLLLNNNPRQPDLVPRAIIRHCPPPLEPAITALADEPAAGANGHVRPGDPAGSIRQVHQLFLMLEQNPTPLRPPMPRPKIERYYPVLQGWDYDPQELASIKPQKLTNLSDLTLTVPPPAYRLRDETILQLAPLVGGRDDLDFILALLISAGLFQPGSPLTVWPAVKETFFRQTEPAQWAALARTYFVMNNWSELWPVLRQEPDLQLRRSLMYTQNTPQQLQAHLALFRDVILRVLACLPDNRWVKVDDLLSLLRTVWSRFDRSRWDRSSYFYYSSHNRAGWYLARRNTDQPLSPDAADWDLAQGNFVLQMLTGPLYWLGLLDLLEIGGRPVEIRLHGLADLYWDRVETPDSPYLTGSGSSAAPPPAEAVTIVGEMITINPTTISTQAHHLLENLARLDEALPDRFVYILDVRSVHAAFEGGRTLDEMLHEWEAVMPGPVPAQIRNRLESWWQGYGQVRLYEDVTVIEFSDDFALAEMKAVTSLSERLIAEISPRLVLIPAAAVDLLTLELEKAGYTPKQTDRV